jgi:hypothetical protein
VSTITAKVLAGNGSWTFAARNVGVNVHDAFDGTLFEKIVDESGAVTLPGPVNRECS